MYVTREDSNQVRWWNVVGLVAFAAFLVFGLVRPDDVDITSLLFWLIVAGGIAGIVLMAPGMRARRGKRPDPGRV